MKAAVLRDHGAAPRYEDFDDPAPAPGRAVVEVLAAAVHHLDLAKASGRFYTGPPPLPSVVGSDGVGRREDGTRVFFAASEPPHGSWAERTLAPEDSLVELPAGVDDAVAAALANTGLVAYLGLSWRARLHAGETVLVLGATGAVGNVAVQAARALGAGRVVAADRDRARLERMTGRGADALVQLGASDDDAAALRDACAGGADVIVDPLWGEPALAALRAAAGGARLVQIGAMAGDEVGVSAALLRSTGADVRAFAFFQAPAEERRDAYRRLAELAAAGELVVDLERVPLAEVGSAWERQRAGAGTKLVLVP